MIPPLDRLPALHNSQVHHHAASHKAPLPGDTDMLEHGSVHHRQVDNGEGQNEASNSSPKEKPIPPHRLEHGERTPMLLRQHVEQAPREVFALPRRDEQQERERRVCRRAGAEHGRAALVVPRVAAVAEPVRRHARRGVRDRSEGGQADEAHGGAVDELVDDELLGEDADAEVVRGPLHHVGLGFLEAETQGKEGRGDEVGPEDLDGGEGEDRATGSILEAETY